MAKKALLLVVVLALIGVGIFFGMRRTHMIGAQNSSGPGGLTAVTADGKPIPSANDAAGQVPENTAQQEANGMQIALALSPYPPSGTQASDFQVTLTDSDGQPIVDATIGLDLTMPAMPMPLNQLDLEHVSMGQYHSSGRFTMRGQWRIEVIITRGGEKQSVFFDVWL